MPELNPTISTDEFKKNFFTFSINQEYSTGLRGLSYLNALWSGFWILIMIGMGITELGSGRESLLSMIGIWFVAWLIFMFPLWAIIFVWQSSVKEKQLISMMENIEKRMYLSPASRSPPRVSSPNPRSYQESYFDPVPENPIIQLDDGSVSDAAPVRLIEDETEYPEVMIHDSESSTDPLARRARELEAEGRFTEALKLYDQCGMMEDVDRVIMLDLERASGEP